MIVKICVKDSRVRDECKTLGIRGGRKTNLFSFFSSKLYTSQMMRLDELNKDLILFYFYLMRILPARRFYTQKKVCLLK